MNGPNQDREVWNPIAQALIAANLTAVAGWLLFGVDSVKHSQIDHIMQTRAPYLHDKPRLTGLLDNHGTRLDRLENRMRELEILVRAGKVCDE